MPTILRFRGFRLMIFTDDHPPPHIHAVGPGKQAVFLLNCSHGPVTLRQRSNMREADEDAIAGFLNANLE